MNEYVPRMGYQAKCAAFYWVGRVEVGEDVRGSKESDVILVMSWLGLSSRFLRQ